MSFSIAVTVPLTTRPSKPSFSPPRVWLRSRREIVAARVCRSGHRLMSSCVSYSGHPVVSGGLGARTAITAPCRYGIRTTVDSRNPKKHKGAARDRLLDCRPLSRCWRPPLGAFRLPGFHELDSPLDGCIYTEIAWYRASRHPRPGAAVRRTAPCRVRRARGCRPAPRHSRPRRPSIPSRESGAGRAPRGGR